MKFKIVTISILTAISFTVSGLSVCCPNFSVLADIQEETSVQYNSSDLSEYYDYYNKYVSYDVPLKSIRINGPDTSVSEKTDIQIAEFEDREGIVLDNANTWSEWKFNVVESGIYSIDIEYYPMQGTGKHILLTVMLDGQVPYRQATGLSLPRNWTDIEHDQDTVFERDPKGNDIRPKQVEKQKWLSKTLADVTGLYSDPYIFHLEEGDHTIRLLLEREAIAVGAIKIRNTESPLSYEEYLSSRENSHLQTGETVILQAEKTYEKSNNILYPTYDKSNASTTPNDPALTRLNTIGQANWGTPGDSISWIVSIPEDGLYRIAFRVKQNFNNGLISYRRFLINGNVPFDDCKIIKFEYDQNWRIQTIGNEREDPYYFYLEDGDIITLECTSGEMDVVLRNVQQAVLDLNALYREIIAITSVDPDIFRDYYLDKQIPDLEENLLSVRSLLVETLKEVARMIGKSGSQASIIDYVAGTLKELADDPHTIPERLGRFKSAIESLGSLIRTMGEQPLELDYIAFVPRNNEMPRPEVGFLEKLIFACQQFVASFAQDYSSISISEDKDSTVTINVWVSTGRDQAQIINSLIQNDFTEKTRITVDLNMVDTGATLIRASLAGKGPDVALMMPTDTPMKLAAREALVDLSKYDLSDIYDQFYESAWVPFYYQGGLYAMPETQVFDVMFYRTDVFREYEIAVPSTWDDFYYIMEVLQKNNMVVGIPEINPLNVGLGGATGGITNLGVSAGISTFDKFLLQLGGQYYKEGLKSTAFDTEEAYIAFERWVELYSSYTLDREYNFYSRFRTGEMPLAIESYTAYNQLMQAAPELRGLWGIAPIPGTLRDDGVVDRSENIGVSGCVMLKSSEKKGISQEAYKFMKWWVDGKTQAEYGKELEAVLGVVARYTPANKYALTQLGWADSELEVLFEQWDWCKGIPQVPGNYVIPRSLTSAFRASLSGLNLPRRSLMIYNRMMNEEITRKRREFNLD